MSSPAPVDVPEPAAPKKRTKRIGGARKLEKRVEPRPDGRYIVYYRPK